VGDLVFLAQSSPEWHWPEINAMRILRRLLGNDSPFGWCDYVTHTDAVGPFAEFCDHFGPVVRLRRTARRYEVTCLRTSAMNRTADLNRAVALVRLRWNARIRMLPDQAVNRAR
jgi:hypothetical protein